MYYLNILFSGWFQQLLNGVLLTIIISTLAFIMGMTIALFFTANKILNNYFISKLYTIYAIFFRGVPELLIILFLFYFLSDIFLELNKIISMIINNFILGILAGSISLGLICGSYLTEILRGAFAAIPIGQIEAGVSLGMNKRVLLFRIIYPQVIAYGWQSISNIWVLILKDSSLVMVIGVSELMFKANLASTATNMPFLFYGIAGILYFIMSFLSIIFFKYFKPGKKYKLGTN